jgi:hypothetical protein
MPRRYEWVETHGRSIYNVEGVRLIAQRELENLGYTVTYGSSIFNQALGIISDTSTNDLIPEEIYSGIEGLRIPNWASDGATCFIVKDASIADGDDALSFNIYTEQVLKNTVGYGVVGVDSWYVYIEPAHRGKELSDYFYLIAESNQRLIREAAVNDATNRIATTHQQTTRLTGPGHSSLRTCQRLVNLGYTPNHLEGRSWVLV